MNARLTTPQLKWRRRLMACALAVPLAVSLAGCVNLSGLSGSPRYACQAPEGVACQSVSGTYANTTGQGATHPGRAAAAPSLGAEPGPSPIPSADGLPLRAAPRVLRLWIKPLEDADGDLHDQGHVYVQIDDGRWQIDHLQRRIREAVAPARPMGASVSPVLRPPQPAPPSPNTTR